MKIQKKAQWSTEMMIAIAISILLLLVVLLMNNEYGLFSFLKMWFG